MRLVQVNSSSEIDRLRELVLFEVIVYNTDGDEVSRTSRLHLARTAETTDIEFPCRPEPTNGEASNGDGQLHEGEATD